MSILHLPMQQEICQEGQAMQHKTSDGGGNQTDFRQGSELLGGSQRERDCGTSSPDRQRLADRGDDRGAW